MKIKNEKTTDNCDCWNYDNWVVVGYYFPKEDSRPIPPRPMIKNFNRLKCGKMKNRRSRCIHRASQLL